MRNLIVISFAAALAISGTALAAASGGNNNNNNGPSPAALLCPEGQVVKIVVVNGKKKKKCVRIESGIISDEELYQQARSLAKEGHYEWALKVLAVIQNQDDPRVLNYTGYSHRKAGRLEIGISYYRKALAINPNFVLAREYLGEGYVAAGRIDLAKTELAEIALRCGTTCEEYKDLAAAITGAH